MFNLPDMNRQETSSNAAHFGTIIKQLEQTKTIALNSLVAQEKLPSSFFMKNENIFS